jgi:hypothetical protein
LQSVAEALAIAAGVALMVVVAVMEHKHHH